MSKPVVRVSIMRCERDRFADFVTMMAEADAVLTPGIRAMRGLRAYVAGADEASSSLTNISVWETLEDARQMETFHPMLDLGRRFAAAGATFERPIMNYAPLWHLGGAFAPPAGTSPGDGDGDGDGDRA